MNTPASGIADNEGTGILMLCGKHQVPQFYFIQGRGDYQVGDAPEKSEIICPVMGCPVGSHQTGTVHAKYHREVLNSHIMDHLIVGTLHKGRIDIAEGDHA